MALPLDRIPTILIQVTDGHFQSCASALSHTAPDFAAAARLSSRSPSRRRPMKRDGCPSTERISVENPQSIPKNTQRPARATRAVASILFLPLFLSPLHGCRHLYILPCLQCAHLTPPLPISPPLPPLPHPLATQCTQQQVESAHGAWTQRGRRLSQPSLLQSSRLAAASSAAFAVASAPAALPSCCCPCAPPPLTPLGCPSHAPSPTADL